MVKNKWISHIWKIYQDIEEYQGKSSCHWDNICGAGVQGKFDKQVFENYAKSHPLIWPFKNSGWEYYELMLDIMPNGISCGNNAFTPGACTFPTGAAHCVTDHSSALNEETALDTPDQFAHCLDINEWCVMLPRDDPPHPMSISSAVISDMPSSEVSAPPPCSAPPSSVRTSDMQSIKVHPPSPLSTVGKQVHSKMTGNDDAISTLLFVNASNIDTVPSSNKCLWLSAAMDHASSCHS
ncbi:hypothetical protein EDC04DRAFT_2907330 [Pisolithus marmoratus]|nr:hypothetical protein EDC04DRAFT_2907330 [Pisolithus marmoratus]